MAEHAPAHAVRHVFEVAGPRGGVVHVLVLSCGSFITRRLKGPPPTEVPCIGCFVATKLATRKTEIHIRRQQFSKDRERDTVNEEDGTDSAECGERVKMDGARWTWLPEDSTCGPCKDQYVRRRSANNPRRKPR